MTKQGKDTRLAKSSKFAAKLLRRMPRRRRKLTAARNGCLLKPPSECGRMSVVQSGASGFASRIRHGRETTRSQTARSTRGKAPGGYQVSLSESRMPFIFLNVVGVNMDVLTLLHDAGHAFHTLAARAEPLLRTAPIEFCEVASLSMELIGGEHLTEFYSTDDAQRARRAHLEAVLTSFT